MDEGEHEALLHRGWIDEWGDDVSDSDEVTRRCGADVPGCSQFALIGVVGIAEPT